MAAPALNVALNGTNQISADNLNTYVQCCDTAAQLRAFIGVTGLEVYMRGFSSIGDGGQGFFYWNASNSASDDGGITTIVPSGASAGGWNRLNQVLINTYEYMVPTNGFSITINNYTNALILNPAGTLATGTVVMPASLFDGQYISISSSQTITTLTISPNTGQTIVGAPTTMTSTTPVKFIFRLSSKTFFRGG